MKRVYFIKPVGMDGPIKIGCSQSPDGRRDTLENWSPFPLEIVAEIEGGFDLERDFHCSFCDLHSHREWFLAGEKLLAVINAINSGEFTRDMLPSPPSGVLSDWRGRRKLPSWVGKQAALTRRAWNAEFMSRYKCPVEYRGVFRDGRQSDIPLIERFIADPKVFGVNVGQAA